jgi:hypothetical protein
MFLYRPTDRVTTFARRSAIRGVLAAAHAAFDPLTEVTAAHARVAAPAEAARTPLAVAG